MQIHVKDFVDLYQKFWKNHKWDKSVLLCENSKAYLYFLDDTNFIRTFVGLADKDLCVEGAFHEIVTLLKHCGKSAVVKFKNNKLKFTSDNIEFVTEVKDAPAPPEVPKLTNKNKIKLNTDDFLIASEFTGEEFPTNFVYYDIYNGAVFSTTGGVIFSHFDFKEPTFGMASTFSKMLSSFEMPIFRYDKENKMFYVEDGMISMGIGIVLSDDKMHQYYNLVEVLEANKMTFTSSEFKAAVQPHVSMNPLGIQIDSHEDNICKIESMNPKNVALRTYCKFNGKKAMSIEIQPKEIMNFINYISGGGEENDLSLNVHPTYSMIQTFWTKKCFHASF